MLLIPEHKSELIIQFIRYNRLVDKSDSLYKRLDYYWRDNKSKQFLVEASSATTIFCIDPVHLLSAGLHVRREQLVTYFDSAAGFESQIFVACNPKPMHRKNHLQSVKLSVTVADLLKTRADVLMKKVAFI